MRNAEAHPHHMTREGACRGSAGRGQGRLWAAAFFIDVTHSGMVQRDELFQQSERVKIAEASIVKESRVLRWVEERERGI